jgi:peptidoglycan hydrolase CwlO-like protein
MKRNLLAALLLFISTSIIWLVICWNLWGRTVANNTTTELQTQDSIINYNAGEYAMLLEEQLELKEQLNYYENLQFTTTISYRVRRDSILIRDTITRVDVVRLVNACDSVISSDSLVIDNLKEQLNIEERKINNLQEVVVAYEQKEDILTAEINTLNVDKKKLEKQKKRRNHALIVTTSVAVISVFLLSVLL